MEVRFLYSPRKGVSYYIYLAKHANRVGLTLSLHKGYGCLIRPTVMK